MAQGEHGQRGAWRRSALAAASALALMGVSLDGQALVLGAVAMRSSLGEPLRAEIEVPQINADEAASLQASVASADTFRAIGVPYTPALSGARVSLHRRANGQAYLRVAADQPVNEPVIGLVIEANWASGRIVRHYTMLVDPPGRAAAAPVLVTPPRIAAPATAPAAAPRSTPAPAVVQAPPASREPVATAPDRSARPAPARATVTTPAPVADGVRQVTVRRGDTAYRIVSAHAPEGVSLDQMLVALLRANPSAFMRGNVNRMKAGAVLTIPTAEQAAAVPQDTAQRALRTHSRDFQAYRRSLAQSARATRPAAAERSAAGSVQTELRDAAAPVPSQDRLTLSRDLQSADKEAALAAARQAQAQSEQVAKLNQNISDLARLQSEAGQAPGAAAATVPAYAASSSSPAESAVTPVAAAPTAPAADAEAASPAAEPATTTSSAAAPAASPAEKATPVAAENPSLLDSLPGYPQLLWAGAGLLALLAAWGFVRTRRRESDAAAAPTPPFLGPQPAADRHAGPDGVRNAGAVTPPGTDSGQAAVASTAEPPAVLPAAAAAAILARDRELDAEQRLKDAIRAERGRVPNHLKLAELYAQRGDALALEAIAVEAYDITQGEGPDWQEIARLGQELDPGNKLYLIGGPALAAAAVLPAGKSLDELYVSLDLDSDLGAAAPGAGTEPTLEPLDFDLDLDPGDPTHSAAAAPTAPTEPNLPPLDFDLDLDFASDSEPTPIPSSASSTPAAEHLDFGTIDFKLDDDAGLATAGVAAGLAGSSPIKDFDDTLAAKLEQARQHQADGDLDTARRLLAALVAEAPAGSVKAEAERLLTDLG